MLTLDAMKTAGAVNITNHGGFFIFSVPAARGETFKLTSNHGGVTLFHWDGFGRTCQVLWIAPNGAIQSDLWIGSTDTIFQIVSVALAAFRWVLDSAPFKATSRAVAQIDRAFERRIALTRAGSWAFSQDLADEQCSQLLSWRHVQSI